jgi:hypothetical protein
MQGELTKVPTFTKGLPMVTLPIRTWARNAAAVFSGDARGWGLRPFEPRTDVRGHGAAHATRKPTMKQES